jgi:hypothetical protein
MIREQSGHIVAVSSIQGKIAIPERYSSEITLVQVLEFKYFLFDQGGVLCFKTCASSIQ